MKQSYKHKTLLLFILLLLFALVIRTLFLDSFPLWIGDEELEFVINAKSIFLTGWSIDKLWSPFNGTVFKNLLPPFPYLFLTPIVGILPFSLFAAKISSVLSHLSMIILVFFLVKKIVGNKEAYAALAIFVINPWSFFFSRTNFEAPLAVTLYLASWVILIYSKGYFLLFALIPIFLAFYSYTGMKLILIPFIIGISYHTWKFIRDKKDGKPLLILTVLCLGLLVFQLFTFHSEAIGQRINEIVAPNSPSIAQSVENERKLAVMSPFTSVFSNKINIYIKYVIGKYFEVFSPLLLFYQGENRATYSLYTHGYFYYIDIIFIGLGFLYLFKKRRSFLFLLLYLLIIGAIPAVISNNPTGFAALRAALIYPLLCIIIGCGISFIFGLKNKRYAQVIKSSVIILYIVSFINLGYIYFFRYPVYASEAYGLSKKILMAYLSQSKMLSDKPVTIYTISPKNVFEHYIFNKNILRSDTSDTIAKIINDPVILYDNLRIVNCTTQNLPVSDDTIIIESGICEKKIEYYNTMKHLVIVQLSDSGGIYKIYNDRLCTNFQLRQYPGNISFDTIRSGHRDTTTLCTNFIINP